MAVQTLSMSSDGRFRFECLDPSIEYRVKVTVKTTRQPLAKE